MREKVLGNVLDKGLFFIVSAPAGTGKTTLVNKLTEEFNCVVRSISYTTRKARKGEIDGKDYFFISEEEFKKKIENDEFLEYANVFGNYYGTSKEFVEKTTREKKHVVLVIDTQGAINLREKKIVGTYIFIAPLNIEVLKKRMEKRDLDTEESIEKRLSWVQKEMEKMKYYDYCVINDELQVAYEVLRSIFIAEEHRINLKR